MDRMVTLAQQVIEQLNATERAQVLAWVESEYGTSQTPSKAVVRAMVKVPELTHRELQVLKALDSTKTYAQVAGRLDISPKTLETYVGRLGAKFRTSGREGILAAARRAHVLRIRKRPR